MYLLIYQRYIAKSIILPLMIITIGIGSIVWVTQALHYINLLDKGIGLINFLGIIILIFPSLLFITMPYITLLSVIYAYHSLGAGRQLIILKNSAISNIRLAIPAFCLTAIITIFCYYISFDLMPRSYSNLRNEIKELQDNYIAKLINEKEFTQVGSGIILYVATKLPDDILEGIVLFDEREDKANNIANTILFAKEGKFSSIDKKIILELRNGYRQTYDSNKNITKLSFDNLIIQLKNDADLYSKNPRSRGFKEFYVKELFERGAISTESNSKLNRNKYLIEGHQRIIWPFFTTLLPLFALSIWLKSSYTRETNFQIIYLIAALVVLITYMHFSFINLAVSNIKFIYLCYANVLFFSIIAITLFFIKEDEIPRFKKIYKLFRK